MLAGVSKSGSPAPRPMTLRPAAFNTRALSVTAIVADGFTRSSAADRNGIVFLLANIAGGQAHESIYGQERTVKCVSLHCKVPGHGFLAPHKSLQFERWRDRPSRQMAGDQGYAGFARLTNNLPMIKHPGHWCNLWPGIATPLGH